MRLRGTYFVFLLVVALVSGTAPAGAASVSALPIVSGAADPTAFTIGVHDR
jgi:hypothetical protein